MITFTVNFPLIKQSMFSPRQQQQQPPPQEEEEEHRKGLIGSFCAVRGFIRLKRKFSNKENFISIIFIL